MYAIILSYGDYIPGRSGKIAKAFDTSSYFSVEGPRPPENVARLAGSYSVPTG